MISVAQAEAIILKEKRDYGFEAIPFMQAAGRILAAPLIADRDLPPFDRVSMDGIAIRFEDYAAGLRQFRVAGIVGAGERGPAMLEAGCCLEIMTGAALPAAADTVVPYEHIAIANGVATLIKETVRSGQNIHRRGSDHTAGAVLVPAGKRLSAFEMSVAASIGATMPEVKKNPRIAIFSSGNELVEVQDIPTDYQIRRSNVYAMAAFLQTYGIQAERIHLPDEADVIRETIEQALGRFDVLLMSGGVSAGKFDYLPTVLQQCGVQCLFHRVQQRPGKPFWFGTRGGHSVVFAFPGNPVSTWLCLLRYFQPWLDASLSRIPETPIVARLAVDFTFEPALQYFMPVRLSQAADCSWQAAPVRYQGSGDYAALLQADGFLELPCDQSNFPAGTAARVWTFPR